MAEIDWRLLRADEIILRTGQTTRDGKKQSLLLYKDARCDMARLDEQFGSYGWQREHKDVHGVSYCGVSLRDPATGEWVTKWDAGEKSKSSPEKGEASDAFKRACVNWGIGRELYTAPAIWVDAAIDPRKLKVQTIEYDETRRAIISLVIIDDKGALIFEKKGKAVPAAPMVQKGGAIYPAKEEPAKPQENEEEADAFTALLADIQAVESSSQLVSLMRSDRVQRSPYVAAILRAGHNYAKEKGWEK